ncbi:hypothetical protein CFP65_0557 [Kitasatospora sp. MMS16-BH015]|nr:hypothetical protein CFP65_0557 [Kitasatospora sp. MMS16-BH015]
MTSFGRTLRLLRQRAGISQPALAAQVFVSQPTISRFESGERSPDPTLARLLDEALGAGGALAGLAPADPERTEFRARRPGAVDRATIVELESGLVELRRIEDASSSAGVTPMVAAQTECIVAAAREVPYALRARAVGVAAMGAAYLGWCQFLAGRYAQAEQMLDRAVAYAYESQTAERLERTMSYRAVLELVWGSPTAAASMFDAARRDTGAHPALRAYDTVQQARALAHAGEHREADRMLLTADRLAQSIDYADLPVGTYWYTPGWLALQRGVAMLAQGRAESARREIEEGYAAMPAAHQQAHWARQWIEVATADRAPVDLILPPNERGKRSAPAARPPRPRRPRRAGPARARFGVVAPPYLARAAPPEGWYWRGAGQRVWRPSSKAWFCVAVTRRMMRISSTPDSRISAVSRVERFALVSTSCSLCSESATRHWIGLTKPPRTKQAHQPFTRARETCRRGTRARQMSTTTW